MLTAANPIASDPTLNKAPPKVKRIRRQPRSLFQASRRMVDTDLFTCPPFHTSLLQQPSILVQQTLDRDCDVLENVLQDYTSFLMCFVAGSARPYRKDAMGQAWHGEPLHIARHEKIPAAEKSVGSRRAQQPNGATGAHTHL